MNEAVQDCVGIGWISDDVMPRRHRQLAGDDGGASLIALLEELEEIEALFGTFQIGWQGYAIIVLIGVIASLVTAAVSRFTVRRFLR